MNSEQSSYLTVPSVELPETPPECPSSASSGTSTASSAASCSAAALSAASSSAVFGARSPRCPAMHDSSCMPWHLEYQPPQLLSCPQLHSD